MYNVNAGSKLQVAVLPLSVWSRWLCGALLLPCKQLLLSPTTGLWWQGRVAATAVGQAKSFYRRLTQASATMGGSKDSPLLLLGER
jgi:hypothetical protein